MKNNRTKNKNIFKKAIRNLEFSFLVNAQCSPHFHRIGIYNARNSIQFNAVCQVIAVFSNVWESFKAFFTTVMSPVYQHLNLEFHLRRLFQRLSIGAGGRTMLTNSRIPSYLVCVCLVLTADRLGTRTGRGPGYFIK